jgi:hypothetical protein
MPWPTAPGTQGRPSHPGLRLDPRMARPRFQRLATHAPCRRPMPHQTVCVVGHHVFQREVRPLQMQATEKYRTTPLRGLLPHPPYFHNGIAAHRALIPGHRARPWLARSPAAVCDGNEVRSAQGSLCAWGLEEPADSPDLLSTSGRGVEAAGTGGTAPARSLRHERTTQRTTWGVRSQKG